MKDFLFTFVTPEKEILKLCRVQEILCPSEKGEINILPEHAPLITLLKPGILSCKVEGDWKNFSVSWGFLEVHSQGTRVLAETAETGVELSKIKIEKRLQDLQKQIEDPLKTPQEIRDIQKNIEKEQARFNLLNSHQN